ncbi:MAG TPA: flagellar biosynthetic protein FliR [Polyangia bacterium]
MWAWLPADMERWLWALGVGSTRTIPLAYMIPAFGGQNVHAHVRMGIGLALSVICLPQIEPALPSNQTGMMFWMLLLARETAVGFTVGYVGSSIFRAAEAAGRLIDTLRGANMAEVISPVTEGRSSPLGDVMLLLTTVIFLELDGVGYIAMALARSYEAVPLTLTTTATSLAGVGRLAVLSSAQLLQSALALAAPAVVAMLLADIVLGAIARMAPQIPVYFVGMPLKALAGVGIVLISLGTIQTALVSGFSGWMSMVDRAFAIWR